MKTLLQVAISIAYMLCAVHSGVIVQVDDTNESPDVIYAPVTPSATPEAPTASPVSTQPPVSNSSSGHSNIFKILQESCKMVRRPIAVPYEGCEPATVTVKTCSGAVGSFEGFEVTPVNYIWTVFFKRSCMVVHGDYKIKPRRVKFNCNGIMEEKRIYLPVLKACKVVNHNIGGGIQAYPPLPSPEDC